MDNYFFKQIFYRAILSSPIIAALAITPIFITNDLDIQNFFGIWSGASIGTLICWVFQVLVFYFLKKKNFPNWTIVIILTIVLLLAVSMTNGMVFINTAPTLKFYSGGTIYMLRFIVGSSINLIIFLLIDLIYSRAEQVRLALENANLQYQNLESDYKLLKAQINPHFLFNALNISKSLIRSQPKKAEQYILQLSDFLRRSLNNEQKSIALKKELQHVQQYVDLQKVRFENTFNYNVNVESNHLEKHLPFFTLTTLVENAIKHNSFSEEEPLNISVNVVDDFLEIKNNLKSKNGVVSTFTGLKNLNERSKMLSGHEIKIDNDNQHFLVKVKLLEGVRGEESGVR